MFLARKKNVKIKNIQFMSSVQAYAAITAKRYLF
jgi:hypothetical protein